MLSTQKGLYYSPGVQVPGSVANRPREKEEGKSQSKRERKKERICSRAWCLKPEKAIAEEILMAKIIKYKTGDVELGLNDRSPE